MKSFQLKKITLVLKKEIKKLLNLKNLQNNFAFKKNYKLGLLLLLLIPIYFQRKTFSYENKNQYQIEDNLKWEKTYLEEKKEDIIWQKIKNYKDNKLPVKEVIKNQYLYKNKYEGIYSFNRSIVFNNSIVGPDISWLVPPGFKWNNNYKFDIRPFF